MMLTLSPGREAGRNLALLGAFCLFLSAVEYMIPKPLPFMRIGLANLPLMLALGIFPLRSFLVLVCIKVFGQAVITGTLFSYIFLFSMTGTFFSALIMYLLYHMLGHRHITFIGIGTAGSVVSSISQLFLAHVFIFRENVRYIAPPFLAAGLATGIVLGIFCEVFIGRSRWYTYNMGEDEANRGNNDKFGGSLNELAPLSMNYSFHTPLRAFTENFYSRSISANALFFTGLLIIPALLFNPVTEYRVIQFLFFLFLVLLSGKKTGFIFSILITLFIVLFNLIIPYGRVLYTIGAFKITSGALEAGIHRAITLQALVMLSKVSIREDLKIPGAFGKLLSESLQIFSAIMEKKLFMTEGFSKTSVFGKASLDLLEKSALKTIFPKLFSKLTEFWKKLTGKNFIAEIDNLMLSWGREELPQSAEKEIKTKPAGFIVLTAAVILSWMPWLFI